LNVPSSILEADYIVSTCCLKTHGYGGIFTMSLKLSVGVIPFSQMSELHSSSNMGTLISEINTVYEPKLIIMDGIKTFISGGPWTGVKAPGNVMVAGVDRIAIDAVGIAILKHLGCTLLNGKIFQQEQIRRAVELNLGIQSPQQIEFITDDEPSREYAESIKSILDNG